MLACVCIVRERLAKPFIPNQTGMSSDSFRDDSPVRTKLPKPIGKQGRHPKAPPGFRRSTCGIGHACSNPRCYTALNNSNIVWDQTKSKKPYFTNGSSKYDLRDIPQASDEDAWDELRRQRKKDKKKQQQKSFEKLDKVLEKEEKKKVWTPQRRKPSRHDVEVSKGFLIPGTPEYEAKIKELKMQCDSSISCKSPLHYDTCPEFSSFLRKNIQK